MHRRVHVVGGQGELSKTEGLHLVSAKGMVPLPPLRLQVPRHLPPEQGGAPACAKPPPQPRHRKSARWKVSVAPLSLCIMMPSDPRMRFSTEDRSLGLTDDVQCASTALSPLV